MVVDETNDVILDEQAKKVVQNALKDGRTIQLELVQPKQEDPSGIIVVSWYRFASKE